jgi:phenylacetate-coenzyme A ligase PaaK-like adenylate-forming protein
VEYYDRKDLREDSMWLTRLMWSAYLTYHMRGQAQFPFKSLDAIKRTQARRVRNMVSHAYRTVPYYRETMDRLGLLPSDFQSADDLSKLPLLERDYLQRDPEYFVSTAQPLNRYLMLRSGGSTGTPCTLYHDTTALFKNAAHGERERSMITALVGKSVGYRETVIGARLSTAQEVQELCQKNGLFPSGIRIQRQYLYILDPPGRNITLLNEFKPDVIHSTFGSYLEILFPYLYTTGKQFYRPKVITYSSTGLSDSVRRLITETCGIPVLSTYQAVEAFKIGFECRQGTGLHLNIDLYPVRIISSNGETPPAGESGDVIVSNLVNRATVLLNYRLGDIACTQQDRCPCERSLPLLSFPQGRCDDFIQLASGQIVHPQFVRLIFTDEDEIWQYQIVQESPNHFRVAVVATTTCNSQETREHLLCKFSRTFGPDTTVEISFVDSIDRTAGKFRTVISMYQRSCLGVVPSCPSE